MHDVLNLRDILSDELIQRREEGYNVSSIEQQVRQVVENGSDSSDAECALLYDALNQTERQPDWPYHEPSTLPEIRAALRDVPSWTPSSLSLSDAALYDRIHAAWLGRCAGCNLGKPVEGWLRKDIRDYLELTNAYPLDNYFIKLPALPTGYFTWTDAIRKSTSTHFSRIIGDNWLETTQGNIRWMARDDDIDYTILGLYLLETYGFDFGPEQVAETWLSHMPFLTVYTAERAAYRNLLYGLRPPTTASYRNPYREWIGAQIRADIWGYVSPGNPHRAATLAFQDASLSHVQNGIYGEMWAAALIAASFVCSDMRSALEISLAEIPPHSRLAEAVHDTLDIHKRGLDWETARDVMETRFYSNYSFVHTINNAAVVTAALLWGEGDYTRTIGLAVQGGWDTDCNGATAGSAFGAMHGTAALPGYWIDPLHDLIRSAVFGYDNSRISQLAERTFTLAQKPFVSR